MMEREMLVRNLFRQIEKDRLKLIQRLIYATTEEVLTTSKGNKKITMIIKIEEEK